jgi:hypothetical protein
MPCKQTLTPEQHRIRFTIGQTVLDTVGVPPGFARMEITAVGPTRWRVNVLVEVSRGFFRRLHCYYANVAPDGTTFTPPLEPIYVRPKHAATEIKPAVMAELAVS